VGIIRRLRSVLGAAALAVLAMLSLSAAAAAQGPAYAAQPPSKGADYRDGQGGRYLLGGGWLYRSDLNDVGQSQGWWRNLAATDGWSPVSVPNSYNANDLSSLSMNGYVGWYRRDFTLPNGAFSNDVPGRGRRWILRFDSVNYRATVWLNGRRLGSHAGAFLPFEFDLSHLRAGVNRLVVRVDNRRTGADIPAGPGGGWWNYGGILGDVYLRAVQRVDISQVQVRPILRCPSCAATIEERATLRNLTGSGQTVTLTGQFGRSRLSFGRVRVAAHASSVVKAKVRIRHPKLWAPGHPSLYRAGFKLLDSRGTQLASYLTLSGVRSIKVRRGGKLELNGRLLHLRGVNIHEQELGSGAALSVAQMGQIIGWARGVGATLIRAHYPLAPGLEEMADEAGILLWSEIPVWHTASAYLNQAAWVHRAHALIQADVATNQNHPSIMLWSVGNELVTPATGPETSYIASATKLFHKLDPTRPVAMAISDWPGVACQRAYAPLDVIGFNDYFGWFDAGGGSTDDRDSLSPFLDSLRACYPNKALFVSEFGFEGNRNGPVEERGTYQNQINNMIFHLSVFAGKPWLSGAIWFALQDFAARPGWGGGNPWPDPPFVQKGMVGLQGNIKPGFPVMQSIYRSTVQIGRRH
jgi:beta-glucuronidase